MCDYGQGSQDDKQENKRENNKRKMSGPHETEGRELVVEITAINQLPVKP